MKGSALRLALKQRRNATRKSPIVRHTAPEVLFFMTDVFCMLFVVTQRETPIQFTLAFVFSELASVKAHDREVTQLAITAQEEVNADCTSVCNVAILRASVCNLW